MRCKWVAETKHEQIFPKRKIPRDSQSRHEHALYTNVQCDPQDIVWTKYKVRKHNTHSTRDKSKFYKPHKNATFDINGKSAENALSLSTLIRITTFSNINIVRRFELMSYYTGCVFKLSRVQFVTYVIRFRQLQFTFVFVSW